MKQEKETAETITKKTTATQSKTIASASIRYTISRGTASTGTQGQAEYNPRD